MKDFAVGFSRNEQGWIVFPRDKAERTSLFFPNEVMKHPAKMNFHLQQSIIEYVAEAGDTILDPFGGTGTLMIAALQDMRVVLIEIEEGYHKLQVESRYNLGQQVTGADELVTLLKGDNRLIMPIPCDHVITSPPYAQAMNIGKVRKRREDAPDNWLVEQDQHMLEYSKSPRNISKLNIFLYNMEMEKIYKLCYRSIRAGGTLTIVLKDRIVNGKRLYLSKWTDKVCQEAGFKLEVWDKWKSFGHGFTNIARSQGKEVVDDEDIIIYRK